MGWPTRVCSLIVIFDAGSVHWTIAYDSSMVRTLRESHFQPAATRLAGIGG